MSVAIFGHNDFAPEDDSEKVKKWVLENMSLSERDVKYVAE